MTTLRSDLERLAELAVKATPGPWKVKRQWRNGREIVPRITCKPDEDRGCGWIADFIGAPYLGHDSTIPNAELTAAAVNFLRAHLPALRELCREDGWRPIESAPKDGTRILLCVVGRSRRDRDDREYYHMASWGVDHWTPFIPNDWTHWRPLPQPPEPTA